MKVAWLQDSYDSPGGAELTCEELLANTEAKITRVAPGDPPVKCDVCVMHNITTFSYRDLLGYVDVPWVKQVHDMWPNSPDARVRSEVLSRASLIFSSSIHRSKFPWPLGNEKSSDRSIYITPPGLDTSRFKSDDKPRSERLVWLGRLFPGKGVQSVIRWAQSKGERVDFYGWGPLIEEVPKPWYMGVVDPDEVPLLLRRYSRFIFLPFDVEPFGRTVVEAALSGCTTVLNKSVGALEWLTPSRSQAIHGSIDAFWAIVNSASKRIGKGTTTA